MAFESTKLSAGIGGGRTMQSFTYTTDIDTKSDMIKDHYWTRKDGVTLHESIMKNGGFIFFTSTLNNDSAEMGIIWFDPQEPDTTDTTDTVVNGFGILGINQQGGVLSRKR